MERGNLGLRGGAFGVDQLAVKGSESRTELGGFSVVS
jgi:hypothetical protein